MTPLMHIEKLKAYQEGRLTYLNAVTVGGTIITVHGSLFRIAKIHNEWFNTAETAGDIVHALRTERLADLFTFRQMLPNTSAQYDFPIEWAAISALPITSYDDWCGHQIRKEVRKNIKKASRRGVEIRRVEFDDELISGIAEIFNEARMRQGRPFWHYGKDVKVIKEEMGQDLERAQFIGAYFEGMLIGFYKLVVGRCFAQPVMSLSMLKHRDKHTDTALISAAVAFCCERGLQYLTYGEWRRDSHRDFLESHGFKKVLLPRYYVPLTRLGSICLKIGAHKELKDVLPEPVLRSLLTVRSRWYEWRFGLARDESNNIAASTLQMKHQIDWRRVWEDQSKQETVSDFELDRGISPRGQEIEELSGQELLDFIEPKASDIVLDAGCGTGVNILRLHSKVRRIIGIDYARGSAVRSQRRIRRDRIETADVLVGSITDIPLSARSVDKIVCMSVLQYLDDAEARSALKEFVRVLPDGGIIVLHVKNLSSIYFATLWLAKKLKGRFRKASRLEYVRPYRWYASELRSLDCEIVGYNSFNLLMIEMMPGQLLALLQRFELRHHRKALLQHPFIRRHGAELKIRARVVKRS